MTCPICSNAEVSELRCDGTPVIQNVFGALIRQCAACDFIFADNLHPEFLEYFYAHYCRSGLTEKELKKIRVDAQNNGRSQLKTIRPYLPQRVGNVLDFGGGSGEAARLYLPFASSVYISESNPYVIKHIREEERLSIIDPEELKHDNYIGFFDLVIFSNVLEHMANPLARMDEISRIIVPDGLLFVEVPNEAPLITAKGIHMAQHITFFTQKTLRLLIEKQGAFEIIDIRNCGAPVSEVIRNRGLTHDFDRLETPDGWVIRALLKNVDPTVELKPSTLELGECMDAIERTSDTLCRLAAERHV